MLKITRVLWLSYANKMARKRKQVNLETYQFTRFDKINKFWVWESINTYLSEKDLHSEQLIIFKPFWKSIDQASLLTLNIITSISNLLHQSIFKLIWSSKVFVINCCSCLEAHKQLLSKEKRGDNNLSTITYFFSCCLIEHLHMGYYIKYFPITQLFL